MARVLAHQSLSLMNPWRIPEDVVFRDLDGEGVLLNLASGTYFALNQTATVVWPLLRDGIPRVEIVAAIVAQFDVTEDAASADLEALIGDLATKGLLAAE